MKLIFLQLVTLIAFFNVNEGNSFFKSIKYFEETQNYDGRIVNGEFAKEGQIPWQVSLRVTFANYIAVCGGSLIHKEWVLTAAHCVKGSNHFKMHFGSIDKREGNQIIESREAYIHEKYNSSSNIDIALIRIPSPGVVENELVKVIPLPLRSDINDSLANQEILVSGWGATNDAGGSTNFLKFANVLGITNEDCKKIYGKYVIVNSTFCVVGKNEESTCHGDSGGPLVYQKNGVWTQCALVSFGAKKGCTHGFPTGNIRTVYFIDWISKITGIHFP